MWELTIGVCILGTAFFLVYLSDKLGKDTFFHDAMKILMIVSALFILLINAALPIHLIENVNATDNPGSITSDKAADLVNLSTTNLKVTQVIIVVFILLFMLWLFVVIIERGYMKHLRKRGLD